ncbi:7-deoxyloganetin glucosyltransferase-like [Phragmites australis]|uniref:7-deoxyloganetin glucosyltransferase-like n=1 Tax=Phragmites australis TaxID=29695 RepID=UPI002D77F383|nr:7-deoxyloganetin glucosyltransferase-like [Phragmites australis]
MGSIAADADKPHAVCVPFPAQGHITPMLKLAKILHHRGFHVTFVNTEYNHRRLLRARGDGALDGLPGFSFTAIPDGLPPSDADATQDVPSLCRSTRDHCLPHFRTLLAELNASPDVPPVTCVVGDDVMSFTLDAAREIGVPCALFWTASACGYMGYRHYRTLMDKGIFPLKDAEQLTNGFLDTPVDWAPGLSKQMRLKDFPSFMRSMDPDEFMFHFALMVTERLGEADAVLFNTFDELEPAELDEIRTLIPAAASIHTIGPLAFLTEEIVPPGGQLDALGSNLWKEDRSVFDWLNGREPGSVVFVNYGSVTVMTNDELLEFAWGLANSGYDFLWIVRPDLVNGDAAVLPPEFVDAIKGRGLLASWCPQEVVLRHEAVGVFLTHSGWNSTMESLCGGLPMLCWPFFAEQQTNCRYKCVEWGVAMEIGHDVRREAVEEKIREAMGGEKGKEMRRRAMEWRDTGLRATRPDGRSYANLEKLVTDVLLSSGKTC